MAYYVDNALAQFENTNALRFYPFVEGCSLVDRTGRELSRDVIVDVHMVVPADMECDESCDAGDRSSTPVVRLSSVHLSPFMVSACFRSEFRGAIRALSVTVERGNFSPYKPYRMEKLAGSEDIGGVVTFGDIDFPGFPETFFMDDAEINPCCISVAKPARLRKIVDLRSGNYVAGDVRMAFSRHIVSEKNGKTYSLSLEDGSAEELASECNQVAGLEMCGATPIKTINGIKPDKDGNIVLWFH